MPTVLDAYPWVGDRFGGLKVEAGGAYVSAACPLRDHRTARLRFWLRDGAMVFGCRTEKGD